MALTTTLADLSVLLVEPSSMQAHLVSRMLTSQGVRSVKVLESGMAALAELSERSEGLVVVSSLYLPDMAGTELVAAMREDPELESIPFILISSETRPQVLEPVRQSGACSIVAKPFTEQQLSRALYAAADYLNPPADSDMTEIDSLRVLVVDDSNTIRRSAEIFLVQAGCQVLLAEDAKALTYRGFHPETAIRVHVEGFARYGHARGPAGFTGARTWEDWLRDFPHPRGDVRRRR